MIFTHELHIQMLDQMPEPIFLKDRSHRYIYGNRAFTQYLGATPEEFLGKTDSDFFSQERSERHWKTDDEVFSTSQRRKTEDYELEQQSNTPRYYLTEKSLLEIPSSEPVLLGTIRDITELKDTEAKLVQSSKLASLGQVLGSIAHEINTPLMVILGNIDQQKDLLQKDFFVEFKNAEKVGKCIEKIESTAERMAKIIRSLKNMARNTESDPKTVQRLQPVVQEAIDLCSDKLRKNEVVLELQSDESIAVQCNSIEITQALINLIQNAVDAVQEQPNKKIEIRIFTENHLACIEVKDNGPSITARHRNKILTPFFSSKPSGKGTGIGLCVTQSIIKRHGGKLELLPSIETCFRISLPIAQT